MLGGCSSQCKAGPSVGGGAASGVLGTLSGWSGGPSGSKYDIFWFPCTLHFLPEYIPPLAICCVVFC